MAETHRPVDIRDGMTEMHRAGEPEPKNSEEAAKRAEHEQIYDLERLLDIRVSALEREAAQTGNPDIAAMAASLRASVSGAHGNLTRLSLLFISTGNAVTKVAAENAAEFDAAYLDAERYASSIYPSFGYYSPEGKRFIAKELQEAFEKSPEIRELKKQFDAMPQAEKDSAKAEQSANQKAIQGMLKDDSFKDVHEHLRIMRSTGMASGPDAQELLIKLQKREISADEFKQKVIDGVATIAENNKGFLNEYFEKDVPKLSRDAMLNDKSITTDGKIDSIKIHMEWGKITLRDKNAAYEELAKHKGDISKLSPEHQRTVHMAQVMIAVEHKTTMEGAMAIMARKQDVAKALTDQSLSVDEKVNILIAEEKRMGTYSGTSLHKEALRQTVLAINETTQEGGKFDPQKPTDFLKKVGENIKENYGELVARKPAESGQASQADVHRVDDAIGANAKYQDFARYISVANSNYANDWDKAEQQAAYKAKWEKIEDSMDHYYQQNQFLEANGVTPAEAAANPETVVRGDAAIMAETKDFMTKYNADQLAKAEAEKAAASAVAPATPTAVVAGTAVVPPPGMDGEAIVAAKLACQALCSSGVTSNAATLASGIPPEGIAVSGGQKPVMAAAVSSHAY